MCHPVEGVNRGGPPSDATGKWTMSIREITCNWKLKHIETARRAIKCSHRTPLGDRSARAIDRSPHIERTVNVRCQQLRSTFRKLGHSSLKTVITGFSTVLLNCPLHLRFWCLCCYSGIFKMRPRGIVNSQLQWEPQVQTRKPCYYSNISA